MTKLYGVSFGNGNDGVSQLFPNFYVRTDSPYTLAQVALADLFIARKVRAAIREMQVDGEAEYTISATLYNPWDDKDGAWCENNGAWKICEVFPADDTEAGEMVDQNGFGYNSKLRIYESIEEATDPRTLGVLKRMGFKLQD